MKYYSLQAVLFILFFNLVSCSSTSKKEIAEKSSSPTHSSNENSTESIKKENKDKANVVKCNLKNDERKIQIKNNTNNGCEVLYTKFGKEKAIASSVKKNNFYCKSILKRVRDNLVKAGFRCE